MSIPWQSAFPQTDYSRQRFSGVDIGMEDRSDLDTQDNVVGREVSQSRDGEETAVEERGEIEKQDNVRGREGSQAIEDDGTVIRDTVRAASETKYTDDIHEWST